jgi:hypothetical protein
MKEDYRPRLRDVARLFMSIFRPQKMEADYMKAIRSSADQNAQTGYDNARVKVSDMKYVSEVETAIQDMGY